MSRGLPVPAAPSAWRGHHTALRATVPQVPQPGSHPGALGSVRKGLSFLNPDNRRVEGKVLWAVISEEVMLYYLYRSQMVIM